jgi:hypothetical protein
MIESWTFGDGPFLSIKYFNKKLKLILIYLEKISIQFDCYWFLKICTVYVII